MSFRRMVLVRVLLMRMGPRAGERHPGVGVPRGGPQMRRGACAEEPPESGEEEPRRAHCVGKLRCQRQSIQQSCRKGGASLRRTSEGCEGWSGGPSGNLNQRFARNDGLDDRACGRPDLQTHCQPKWATTTQAVERQEGDAPAEIGENIHTKTNRKDKPRDDTLEDECSYHSSCRCSSDVERGRSEWGAGVGVKSR